MNEVGRYVHIEKDKYKTQISVVNNCSQKSVTLSNLENRIKELREAYGDLIVHNISEFNIGYYDICLEADSTKEEIEDFVKRRADMDKRQEEYERKEYERLKAKYDPKD
ncbi:hypothetical protein E6Q11_05855 [Candidatus Dojkabacteria bacterium]|uniref:Uncharacterized protein n=1 Tax=Candidatus Dojkabacteria bacterium TaxID=2099670 RepID=A0A5C7J5W9_9BACT|nr:MAG: hypothetical protein E6Q11_05855 [Candidatus Dojkabacteria bacterium]